MNFKQCLNFEFCQMELLDNDDTVILDKDISYDNKFCEFCNIAKWDYIDCNETCYICKKEMKTKIKFPTNCGHSFCLKCMKEIFIYDENRYVLNPIYYGGPACPMGCNNPKRGYQCSCDEFWNLFDEWIDSESNESKQYADDDLTSKCIGELEANHIYTKMCPICKSIYDDYNKEYCLKNPIFYEKK